MTGKRYGAGGTDFTCFGPYPNKDQIVSDVGRMYMLFGRLHWTLDLTSTIANDGRHVLV